MNTPSTYAGRVLQWKRKSLFSSEHQLCDGETVVATMKSRSTFSSVSLVSGFGGNWEFSRRGFFQRLTEIREKGMHLPFATFRRNMWRGDGLLELPKGERLTFTHKLLKGEYSFTISSGEAIVSLEHFFSFTYDAKLTIGPQLTIADRFPWLPMLIWYIAHADRQKGQ